MKKILLPLMMAAVIMTASCGKNKTSDDVAPSPSPTPAATAAATSSPEADTPAPSADTDTDTGGTNINRMSAEEVADEVINEGRTKNAFIDQWRAVGTTSDNAAFTSLELTITESGYTVIMTFDNYDGAVTYEGEYTLKNGILTFDENFLDCTAYFYKSDYKTLVIDNSTSLVFCEHLEQEREMR